MASGACQKRRLARGASARCSTVCTHGNSPDVWSHIGPATPLGRQVQVGGHPVRSACSRVLEASYGRAKTMLRPHLCHCPSAHALTVPGGVRGQAALPHALRHRVRPERRGQQCGCRPPNVPPLRRTDLTSHWDNCGAINQIVHERAVRASAPAELDGSRHRAIDAASLLAGTPSRESRVRRVEPGPGSRSSADPRE